MSILCRWLALGQAGVWARPGCGRLVGTGGEPAWHARGQLLGRGPPAGKLPLPPAHPTGPRPAVVPAAAVKEGNEDKHPYIVACLVKTPKMEVSISQTWGWARAQANPELEGWTAPYTWLDADVVLLKALAAPVTVILGECLGMPHGAPHA